MLCILKCIDFFNIVRDFHFTSCISISYDWYCSAVNKSCVIFIKVVRKRNDRVTIHIVSLQTPQI